MLITSYNKTITFVRQSFFIDTILKGTKRDFLDRKFSKKIVSGDVYQRRNADNLGIYKKANIYKKSIVLY